jgi:hypothetical protein
MIKLQGQDKLLARLAKARHPNAVVRLATVISGLLLWRMHT